MKQGQLSGVLRGPLFAHLLPLPDFHLLSLPTADPATPLLGMPNSKACMSPPGMYKNVHSRASHKSHKLRTTKRPSTVELIHCGVRTQWDAAQQQKQMPTPRWMRLPDVILSEKKPHTEHPL